MGKEKSVLKSPILEDPRSMGIEFLPLKGNMLLSLSLAPTPGDTSLIKPRRRHHSIDWFQQGRASHILPETSH